MKRLTEFVKQYMYKTHSIQVFFQKKSANMLIINNIKRCRFKKI